MIRFRCHHCMRLMKVGAKFVGHVTDCPECGHTFVVPSDGEISAPVSPRLEWDDNLVEQCTALQKHAPQKLTPYKRENPATEFHQSLTQMVERFSAECLPPSTLETETVTASSKHYFAGRNNRRLLVLLVIGILSAAGGLGVFLVPSEKESIAKSGSPSGPHADKINASPAEPGLNRAEEVVVSLPVQVEGRLRVRTDRGDFHELKNARIVLLPESPQSSLLMATLGIEQKTSPENRQLARQRLSGAGGAFTTTDDEGAYELHLKRPGTYYLFILSEMIPEALVSAEDLIEYETILTNYFQHPQEFLQNSPVKLLKVTVQEGRVNYFDVDLERS